MLRHPAPSEVVLPFLYSQTPYSSITLDRIQLFGAGLSSDILGLDEFLLLLSVHQ